MSKTLGLQPSFITGQPDIYFVDGQIAFVTEKEYVAQRIQTRLLLFLGEWFLDTSQGVDWFGSILTKPVNMVTIEGILKATIINTPDVTELLTFTSDFQKGVREYNVNFSVDTVYGQVNGGVSSG